MRDEWIAEDLAGWLAPNRIYDGVAAPMKGAMGNHEVYVVTTKQVKGDGGKHVIGQGMHLLGQSPAALHLPIDPPSPFRHTTPRSSFGTWPESTFLRNGSFLRQSVGGPR